MITLQSAENVLKDVYLGVIADQINTKTNPLYSRIRRSTRNIVGKEVRVVAPIGINGGIMAGQETSDLPEGVPTPYLSFVAPLKNLFGRFEISDKAVRCSSSDVNSFVNLLQDGMDSLLKASIFNLSRMLYGDGTGLLATLTNAEGTITVDNAGGVAAGMYVDIVGSKTTNNVLVKSIDPITKKIVLGTSESITTGDKIYLHGSKDAEILGLKAIVGTGDLYGVNRTEYPVMNAKNYTASDKHFDEDFVQSVIDDLETEGTNVNFINCSYQLKRAYQGYQKLFMRNVDIATLEDGTKVITHFGVPIVPTNCVDDKECYFLNTDDFMFYELGDWKWLEDESGRILKQSPTKAAFSATLVKYTELLCHRPSGVGHATDVNPEVE